MADRGRGGAQAREHGGLVGALREDVDEDAGEGQVGVDLDPGDAEVDALQPRVAQTADQQDIGDAPPQRLLDSFHACAHACNSGCELTRASRLAGTPDVLLSPALQRRGQRLHVEGLDDVPGLDLRELVDDDAALEAVTDLLHVILHDAKAGDLALVDDDAAADHADVAAALDEAAGDAATGDDADLGDREQRADLGLALLGDRRPDGAGRRRGRAKDGRRRSQARVHARGHRPSCAAGM